MSDIQPLLDHYGESHQHPHNKMIHIVCVPVIVWSVIALLWYLPFPLAQNLWLNWPLVVLAGAQIYYFKKSLRLGAGLLLVNLAFYLSIVAVLTLTAVPLWQVALAVFILAWIGQFIGHKIEGKKPSFFEDVQYLLIGPAWLLAWAYQRLGWRY